jgi:hypothetical protein
MLNINIYSGSLLVIINGKTRIALARNTNTPPNRIRLGYRRNESW